MMQLVLDTNIYLHAKFFDELSWDELAKDDVCIVVPQIVLRELDARKFDARASAGTRQRATKVMKRLLELLEGPMSQGASEVEVRKRVRIRLDSSKPDFGLESGLDRESQDDHVLAATLATRATLCTADEGLMLRSLSLKVPYVKLPPDWLEEIPPNPAERELQLIKNKAPVLELVVFVAGSPLEEGGLVELKSVRPPTDDEVMIRARRRRSDQDAAAHRNRSRMAHSGWLHGDDIEREREREQKRTWDLERSVRAEAITREVAGRTVAVGFSVRNTGKAPATELRVESEPAAPIILNGDPVFVSTKH